MSDRKTDPRVEAGKLASLGIVWSVLAAVAYLGPIKGSVDAIKQSVHSTSPAIDTAGLRLLHFSRDGVGTPDLFNLALTAVPFAIGAALLMAILTRVRPALIVGPILLLLSALVGFVASGVLFLDQVYTPANQATFLVAVVTIGGLWLVVRLEHQVRRLNRRNPAVASLLLAVLIVAYLVAASATTIPALILDQVDLWLALASFGLVLYAAIRAVQESIRLR